MTKVHQLEVFGRDAAIARLSDVLNQAAELNVATARMIGADYCDPATFIDEFTDESQRLGVVGANPNPMFDAMTALEELRDQGLVQTVDGPERKWRRPVLSSKP